MSFATSVGLQVRHDDDRQRATPRPIPRPARDCRGVEHRGERAGRCTYEEDVRPAPWVRFVLGARGDRVDVAVDDAGSPASHRDLGRAVGGTRIAEVERGRDASQGTQSVRRLRPRLPLQRCPRRSREAARPCSPLRPDTKPACASLRRRDYRSPRRRFSWISPPSWSSTATPDTTEPAGATRREGLELVARYHLGQALFADAALTLNRARFRDNEGSRTLVPLAPTRTFVAGVGAREPVGPVTVFGSVRIKSMADRQRRKTARSWPRDSPSWTRRPGRDGSPSS